MNRRELYGVVVAALGFDAFACVGCGSSSRNSDGRSGADPATDAASSGPAPTECTGKSGTAGDESATVNSGGLQRTYLLHVPQSYDPTVGTMLVIAYHGFSMPSSLLAGYSGLSALSDEKGFLVAYPQGQGNAWNGGACCPGAAPDDVQFTRDMVTQISESYCVNSRRIHATGLSNGALFSNRLACEASDLIASIAPVAGGLGVDCQPTRPVAHLAFWGTADPFVSKPLVDVELQRWQAINGCAAQSQQVYAQGDATCEDWSPCNQGANTVLCTIQGGGHTWPGSAIDVSVLGPTSKTIDASREMLTFFEQHAMP